jgi:hypothetical protein
MDSIKEEEAWMYQIKNVTAAWYMNTLLLTGKMSSFITINGLWNTWATKYVVQLYVIGAILINNLLENKKENQSYLSGNCSSGTLESISHDKQMSTAHFSQLVNIFNLLNLLWSSINYY